MGYEKIEDLPNRRPVAARRHPAFMAIARGLQRAGISPNMVSVTSVVFALLTFWALATSANVDAPAAAVLYLVAAAFIGLRGVCNVVDGLIAIEGEQKSPLGDLYNDFPDRLSDVLTLIGAGMAASTFLYGLELGLGAALMAVATAYTRHLGASAGARQCFAGPMAKTGRMAAVAIGCGAAAAERLMWDQAGSFTVILVLVIVGCAASIVERLRIISRELRAK